MAKKAQASGKTSANAKAKKPIKAVALAKTLVASTKATKAKPPVKAQAAVVSKVAKPTALQKKPEAPVGAKKTAVEPTTGEAKKVAPVKPAPKTKAEKAIQAAETAEKIKIDKNMTEEQAKWAEMYNKYKDVQTTNYDMKATFKAATPLQHKVLGWGWIVSNENDRLEVLFKDGKRMLISNYRG